MHRNQLKELIVEHKERFFDKTNLIHRDIQNNISSYLNAKEIVLITGVRRSGKSSLMRLICDDLISLQGLSPHNILYMNFEDERLIDFTVNDFDLLYELFLEIEAPVGKMYFFLDEIQNVKAWEKWVNRLYEFESIKIFVTGSNASLLRSDVSSALTGRNRQIINWPFSFHEYLKLQNYSDDKKKVYLKEDRVQFKRLLNDYIAYGGFPEVLKQKDLGLLEQYFRDILYRDLIAAHSIKNVKEIRELCLFLASNTGSINSYESMRKIINASNVTSIKNYIEAMEDCFLFFKISLFDYSIKRQIYNPSKYYSVDNGLSRMAGFNFSENIGHYYENTVFLELKRRGKDVFYWKSLENKEVDFMIKETTGLSEAIQVCVSMENEKTRNREMAGLMSACEKFNLQRLLIITEAEEGEEKIGNKTVQIIPLWKWLITNDNY